MVTPTWSKSGLNSWSEILLLASLRQKMAQGSQGSRAEVARLGHFKLYVFACVQPNPVTNYKGA